jgi:HicB family
MRGANGLQRVNDLCASLENGLLGSRSATGSSPNDGPSRDSCVALNLLLASPNVEAVKQTKKERIFQVIRDDRKRVEHDRRLTRAHVRAVNKRTATDQRETTACQGMCSPVARFANHPFLCIDERNTLNRRVMEKQEEKTATIMMRVRPSLKEKAEARAAEEGRSLTNYIERLIETDTAKLTKPKPRK